MRAITAAVLLLTLGVAGCSNYETSASKKSDPLSSSPPIVIGGAGSSTTTTTRPPRPSGSSIGIPTTTLMGQTDHPATTVPGLTPMEPVKCDVRDGVPHCFGWRIGGPERPASEWWSTEPVAAPLSGMGAVSVGHGPICAASGDVDHGQGAVAEGRAELWCWGEGFDPEGMTGRHYRRIEEPVLLHAGDDLDGFAAGYRTVCAIFGIYLWCWGKVPGGWATTGRVLMSDSELVDVEVKEVKVTAKLRDGTSRDFFLA